MGLNLMYLLDFIIPNFLVYAGWSDELNVEWIDDFNCYLFVFITILFFILIL